MYKMLSVDDEPYRTNKRKLQKGKEFCGNVPFYCK